jgi:hypothetical protein
MLHQFLGGDMLYDTGIDRSAPLPQAQNDTFTGSSATTFTLASSSKITFIQLDFTLEFSGFQFGHMKERLTDLMIHSHDGLVIQAQVRSHPVGRLELVEPCQDGYLPAQLPEAFLPTTPLAFDIAACCVADPERSAKNTFFTPQKVGRATQMACFHRNTNTLYHMLGYDYV